jgi:hypothetical protein
LVDSYWIGYQSEIYADIWFAVFFKDLDRFANGIYRECRADLSAVLAESLPDVSNITPGERGRRCVQPNAAPECFRTAPIACD